MYNATNIGGISSRIYGTHGQAAEYREFWERRSQQISAEKRTCLGITDMPGSLKM
jgi:hypothetical protein